jgi:plasmid stabilization system protein ParE
VARVLITPRARRDVEEAIDVLGLPQDTWKRIERSLSPLSDFPLAGRALEGRWAPARFLLGPWPWMTLVYVYEEARDRAFLVGVYDARSAEGPGRDRALGGSGCGGG